MRPWHPRLARARRGRANTYHCIGIDVHKKTSHIVVLEDGTGRVLLDKNIRTKKDRFEVELGPLAPAKVLIESSTLARWVADFLGGLGFTVIVGNPNYPLMYASRPANRKNDREDARALAFACHAGHFRPVHRVSDAHRAIEELLGSRALVVGTRTTHVNRIRALYAGAGLTLPACDAARFRVEVTNAGVAPTLVGAIQPLLEMLAMVDDQLHQLDRRIEQIADAHPIARLLMTVPGVGPIVALAFIATIDTVGRFGNAHMLESYLGLVPRLHASAGPGDGGHISKMGATYLRSLLVQAAWAVLRSKDPSTTALQTWTNTLAQRRSPKVAVVALARRLAGVLFAIWRDGKPFELRESKFSSATPAKPLVRRYDLKSERGVTKAS